MTEPYRYLAGYKFGGRVSGEKRFGDRFKVRHHMVDTAGRMYWCGCLPGWRRAGIAHYAGRVVKQFKHRHGSKHFNRR